MHTDHLFASSSGVSARPNLIDFTSHPALNRITARHPQESIHRRLIPLHTWIIEVLHEGCLSTETQLAELLAQVRARQNKDGDELLYATDYHLLHDPNNEACLIEFEELLRRLKERDEWIIRSAELANMPDPHLLYIDQYRRLKKRSKNGFGPTTDDVSGAEQDPIDDDLLSLKKTREKDIVSDFTRNQLIKPYLVYLKKPVIKFLGGKNAEELDRRPPVVGDASLDSLGDFLTCILAPSLLMVSMYALNDITTMKTRLVLIGLLGLAFSFAVWLLCRPKRHVLFSTTASFCQVLSVFVGTTSNSSC